MTSVHAAARTPGTSSQFDTVRLPRAYGVLLLVLAGVLLLNSILGPLVLNIMSYPITDSMENQLIGLELITALLVAPWATLAGLAALRGRPAAPSLVSRRPPTRRTCSCNTS